MPSPLCPAAVPPQGTPRRILQDNCTLRALRCHPPWHVAQIHSLLSKGRSARTSCQFWVSPALCSPPFFSCASHAKAELSQVTFLRLLYRSCVCYCKFWGRNCLFSTGRAGSFAHSGANLLQLPLRLLQQLMRAGTCYALKYRSRVTNAVKSYNLMQP